ncbi:MAG: GIY-YIG nuclease family protein [Opitutales bacterium]
MGEVRKSYSVYVMTNKRNGTLYVGVSGRLWERVLEHKNGRHEGFTKRYQLTQLVYFETFGDVNNAIRREKRLKSGSRRKKLHLIESMNPDWSDLSAEWYD